jgi:hypothetical protein
MNNLDRYRTGEIQLTPADEERVKNYNSIGRIVTAIALVEVAFKPLCWSLENMTAKTEKLFS